MPTTLRSFSKINLGLRIGPFRPDRFHSLRTLYQTLAAHDMVTVTATFAPQTTITITSNNDAVPTNHRNTAWRIVNAALHRLNRFAHVSIHIQKNLPIQGGMGAGSANAAAALLGLERELGIALSASDRLQLAADTGSDVPLFLIGGTSMGIARGEEIIPYPDLPPTPCVIAAPPIGVSTPAAFVEWDRRTAESYSSPPAETNAAEDPLTTPPPSDRLVELGRIYASVFTPTGSAPIGASGVSWAGLNKGDSTQTGDLAGNPLLELVRTGIENDFEEVVFQLHPSLRAIKHALTGNETAPADHHGPVFSTASKAIFAGLSGSGSALFGLYHSVEDAEKASQRIEALGVRVILTSTLPRSEYWQTMFV